MSKITNTGVFIVEGSAAAADVAGSSQIWTKSDVPSSLYHTDDAGIDHRLGITQGTATASTSGTSIDFTGIPSGVKRIQIGLVGVSAATGSDQLIQLGDGGGFETSGYLGTAMHVQAGAQAGGTHTDGFQYTETMGAASIVHGLMTLVLVDASTFTWCGNSIVGLSNTGQVIMSGTSKSLDAELTQVRITTVSGSVAFDAGKINIQFE
jgi:hypothetical protein